MTTAAARAALLRHVLQPEYGPAAGVHEHRLSPCALRHALDSLGAFLGPLLAVVAALAALGIPASTPGSRATRRSGGG